MVKINIQNVREYIPQNLASSEQLSDDAKVMLAVIVNRSVLYDDNNISVARLTFLKMGGLEREQQSAAEKELERYGLIRFHRGGVDKETGKVFCASYEIMPDAWNKPLTETSLFERNLWKTNNAE